MKKLKKLILDHKATIMTAPQMKHVTGGRDSGTCAYKWTSSFSESGPGYAFEGFTLEWGCNVSKSEVDRLMKLMKTGNSFFWCCDSCESASWYANLCG